MTREEREEAIRCLSVHSSTNGSGLCTDEQHYKAKQMAIQALSQEPTDDATLKDIFCMGCEYKDQEPCDDAISRILKRMWNYRGKHTTSIDKVAMEQIIRDKLPPVTQKPIECDDAISRDFLFRVLDNFCGHDRTATITLDTLADIAYELPSVTQKGDVKNV